MYNKGLILFFFPWYGKEYFDFSRFFVKKKFTPVYKNNIMLKRYFLFNYDVIAETSGRKI